MTAVQRRRSRQVLASLEAQDRYTTQLALATPRIDVADLATLLRCDKLAAAAALATLDERALVVQAIAFSTYLNETYGYEGETLVWTEDVLRIFQQQVRVYRASRVEE